MGWSIPGFIYEDLALDAHNERVLEDLDAFAEPEFSEPERHWPAPIFPALTATPARDNLASAPEVIRRGGRAARPDLSSYTRVPGRDSDPRPGTPHFHDEAA